MKATTRRVLRIAALGVAMTAMAPLVTLDVLDNRPFLTAPYYEETTSRMEAQAATNLCARGQLEAGFGRALLTPMINAPTDDPMQGQFRFLPLAGYGGRQGRPATGTHDDLHVKAIAVRVGDTLGVIIGADALIIPREVTEAAIRRLEKELGLRREQVYLGATHTHAGLGAWGKGKAAEAFAGKFQEGVWTWFADRIVAAARGALADLKPAALGQGRFSAPNYVRNRLVGDLGRVDSEFSYAVFKQNQGRCGILGSFSAHATVLSSGNMEFSGDYPGGWQRTVEQATGGIALFLAGGVGSHSPVPGKKGFEGAERMGRELAGALLDRLPHTQLTNHVAFSYLGLDVSLPEPHVRLSDGLRLRPWIAARLLAVRSHSFLQGFRLDNAVWISTPCDFSGEMALDLKDFLRARGGNAVVTSFNGDYVGYIIPARYYHLGGYEPRTMSFYGPTLPDYFEELTRKTALHLTAR